MVESNHDEERLARIEHMLESLQGEAAAFKIVASKLIALAVQAAPAMAATPFDRRKGAKRTTDRRR
jgi:hypothetical protein